MDLKFCRHIRVVSHEELFHKLIEATKSDPQDTPWPTVRVAVGSQVYSGSPIKIEETRDGSWLVLFTSTIELDALSIIPMRSISGVSLLDPQEFKAAICEPGPWTLNGDVVPPSRFEIERMLSSTAELLRPLPSSPQIQLRWETFEAEPTSRILAAEALKALQKLLPKILGDQIGREAVQGIQTWELRFQPDAAIKAKRQGAVFQIDFGFKANLKQFEQSLSFEVEKNL